MQANWSHHSYPSLIWPFEYENCGKEAEKIIKVEYLKKENNF